MITWTPIDQLPEALKDGRPLLLHLPPGKNFDGGAIEGWWFSSPKEIDDGWETIVGGLGEPTHFAEINAPEGDQ